MLPFKRLGLVLQPVSRLSRTSMLVRDDTFIISGPTYSWIDRRIRQRPPGRKSMLQHFE